MGHFIRHMSDLSELERKQADAARYAERMAEEKDPDRLLEMAKEMQQRAADIGATARAIEQAMRPQGGSGAETVVVLTPAQRQRIAEQTGVGVEKVVLRDTEQRIWGRDMPAMEPRIVEKMAALQAAESRLIAETRDQVEKIARQLEDLNVPELAETIAGLRRDPTLGLQAKKK